MDDSQQYLKKLSKIALAAMGVLLVGSIVFYKEHLFFGDLSYDAFNIINYSGFAIVGNRWGEFITQIIPYLGQKLHLPIGIILVGYSASFNLFYFVVNALLIYRFKQYSLAILMAIYYFLFVSDSFFMVGDIQVAVAWMFLFFAVMIDLGHKKVNHVLIAALSFILFFLALSTHFLVIIPTVFLWVYFILEKRNWPFDGRTSLVFSLVLVGIIASRILSAQPQSYDGDHLYNILHISFKDIFDAFSEPVVVVFYRNCLLNYWAAIFILTIGIIALLRGKDKKLLAWTIVSCVGYLIIMGITYAGLDANILHCHIELEWGALAIIVCAPFVLAFIPKLKPSIGIAVLTTIFIVRLAYIGLALPAFMWRTHFKDDVMSQMKKKGINKLAIYEETEIQSKFMLNWAVPYETILSSSMHGDKPQLTFVIVNPDDKKTIDMLKTQNGFYNAWSMVPCNALNKEYFCIDSTKPYQIMTYAELLK